MPKHQCDHPGCPEPHKAFGYCQKHYDRLVRPHRHRVREDRVLSTRARNRAAAALIKAHPDEFQRLHEAALREVKEEHDRLLELAAERGLEPSPIVRLRRGPAADDDLGDRINTQGRCPGCAVVHRNAHVCPDCGLSLEDADEGQDVDEIAVERVLKGDYDIRLNGAERRDALVRMLRRGDSQHKIAKALHVSGQTLVAMIEALDGKEASSKIS